MSSNFFSLLGVVALRIWKKTLRRPVTLTFSLLQPLIWMLFFGFLMYRYPLAALPSGIDYVTFLAPGICAMTVLFGASQAGIGVIRDMQTGFLQRMLATPAPYWALHVGKISADGVRLLAQAAIVLVLAVAIGASLSFSPLPLLLSFLSLFFFAIGFGSLSCIIALRSRRQETLATFVHVINMPLFFTSTALVPHKQMPSWLATIAAWNPLTLVVESLRGALLFQAAPSWTTHQLPVILLALGLVVWATFELRRGSVISAWETK
ncbi:MAG TPA: ABC transporter permease [Bdellovibrionota bacterium]|nr:ABC transporter permease [Bdellovibrionota bacterium]